MIGVDAVVSHPFFGCGRVIKDCGDSWKIRFKSGKERNILKSYDKLKLEPALYWLYRNKVLCGAF